MAGEAPGHESANFILLKSEAVGSLPPWCIRYQIEWDMASNGYLTCDHPHFPNADAKKSLDIQRIIS